MKKEKKKSKGRENCTLQLSLFFFLPLNGVLLNQVGTCHTYIPSKSRSFFEAHQVVRARHFFFSLCDMLHVEIMVKNRPFYDDFNLNPYNNDHIVHFNLITIFGIYSP